MASDLQVHNSSPAPTAEHAGATPQVDWDYQAAIAALAALPPASSIFHELLEHVGSDPTGAPVYRLRVQARAMLDHLRLAFFPVGDRA
jgi:hypothetical protein